MVYSEKQVYYTKNDCERVCEAINHPHILNHNKCKERCMAESDDRPVNLDLFSIRFPITAIASILHRISGVVLFFGTFVFMYLLDKSLVDEAGFGEVRRLIADPCS